MDERRFDTVTKVVGASRSRRVLLAVVATALTGAPRLTAVQAHKRHTRTGRNIKKRQTKAETQSCREQGHSCEGNQVESCCERLACTESSPGSARRCTPVPPPPPPPPICSGPFAPCIGSGCSGTGVCRARCIGDNPPPGALFCFEDVVLDPPQQCSLSVTCLPGWACAAETFSPVPVGPCFCRPVCS